jgi:drug/metabolite transporter superfamily protein YnfA
MKESDPNEFEKAAAGESRGGLLRETWEFLRENKKWWLLPIVLALILFGGLILLAGTGLAPFIYTLF